MKEIKVLNTLKIENNTSIFIDSNGFGIKTGDTVQDEYGVKHKVLSVGMTNTHGSMTTTSLLIEGTFNSSKICI
jgi:hypothetical protein